MGAAAIPVLVGATVVQGAMSMQASRKQARSLKQQAASEKGAAVANEAQFRTDQARAAGARRAALGGAGVDPQSGSPLEVTQDIAREVELQARRIRAGGNIRATRLRQQAGIERSAGMSSLLGGVARAGSLLIPSKAAPLNPTPMQIPA